MSNDLRKRKNKLVKLAITIILIGLTILGVDIDQIIPNEIGNTQNVQNDEQNSNQSNEDVLELHMINIGQGDSFLLIQNKEAAIIDFGDIDKGTEVAEYLKNKGITKLKYASGSHPDSDHMGGMYDVITNIEVETILLPNLENYKTTKVWYKKLQHEMYNGKYHIEIADVGNIYNLGNAQIEVLGPINDAEGESNNYSTIFKVSFGDMDILFTGDAEKEVETDLLEEGTNLEAEILKVGHHGSNTSTTEEFLDAINPEYALISTGDKYGHPTKKTMDKLEERDIEVYRTDECGTVICTITYDDISFSCDPGDYLSGNELKERKEQ